MQLNCSSLPCFSVFWMTVSDDEAMLVVASAGDNPHHSSSHGFYQMELLVAISELQHIEIGSRTH